ncbi:thioesterase domain-containing protein/aryl carrier-like protein [Rhizobium sp. SG_E_25_P2]|uniref:thioesterase domain-containing protein n=1 Tax=Rhizobium sp. SG_E_25_P2 TaxID=2879942 RepID=UPI002476AEC0|nr:thioesterase domain-containing protein [Rhizobium sp. SG_E_25_P2]MDH6267925.1 thioesterase domain-containing protein/aryl carrier-like protein [Rhizobium sp. SG_E_25_P2]
MDPRENDGARPPQPAADRVEQTTLHLLDIAAKTWKLKLTPQDDLLARGLSVNRALRIIADYWRASGTELDVNIFFRCRTMAAIAQAIEAGLAYSDEKLVVLRDGDAERPLFCYAGGANCFVEMRDMIAALPFSGRVYGLTVTARPFHPNVPPTVEREVRDAVVAIRRIQPHGPYRLLGFSFGGVLALEVARALEAEGDKVDFLGMLDSPLSDHCITASQWLTLMARIVCRQAISRLPVIRRQFWRRPAATAFASAEPSAAARKGHRLLLRFLSPVKPDYHLYNPQWMSGFPPRYSAMGEQIIRMKGLYRPRRYENETYFFTSHGRSPIDCSSRDVWSRYLDKALWIEASGTHLSMLVGRNGKALAMKIGERLDNPDIMP